MKKMKERCCGFMQSRHIKTNDVRFGQFDCMKLYINELI